MPMSKMNDLGLIKWIETNCDKRGLSEDIEACLEEKGGQSFKDLISNSQNVNYSQVDVQSLNGVVHYVTLKKNTIPVNFPYFILPLEPKYQYQILFIDPTFKFLSPNPLAVRKTALKLTERSTSTLIYFQVDRFEVKSHIVNMV